MAIIEQMSVTGKSMNNDLVSLNCSPSKYNLKILWVRVLKNGLNEMVLLSAKSKC